MIISNNENNIVFLIALFWLKKKPKIKNDTSGAFKI